MTMIYDLQHGARNIKLMRQNGSKRMQDQLFPGIKYNKEKEKQNMKYLKNVYTNIQHKLDSSYDSQSILGRQQLENESMAPSY